MITTAQHELMTRVVQGDPTAYNTSNNTASVLKINEYNEAEELLTAAGELEMLQRVKVLAKTVNTQRKKNMLRKNLTYLLLYVITYGMMIMSCLVQILPLIIFATILFVTANIYTPIGVIHAMEEHRL